MKASKMLIWIWTAVLCLGWGILAQAQNDVVQNEQWTKYALDKNSSIAESFNYNTSSMMLLPEHQFELVPEFSYITYKENSLEVKESGPFVGLYTAYTYRPMAGQTYALNAFHFDMHGNYGSVDYKSPDGKIDNINDYMVEPRFWVGKDLNMLESTRITPYAGVGYRHLFDHFGAKGRGTYDRRSQYLYAPVGFQLATEAFDGWKLGLNAEYDIFIRGWQTSYLSQNNSGAPNVTNPQRHGYGLRGSVDIIKKDNNYNFLFSPYIRYWNIKQSDTVTATGGVFIVTGYEPANTSTEVGLRLGAQF